MPLEITVGSPQLVIHEDGIVWTSELDGQVTTDAKKGLLFRDTRLISSYGLSADGVPWDLLNAGAITHFAAQVFLTNRKIVTRDGVIQPKTIGLMLGRYISGGVHEDLELVNYGRAPVRFNLEVMIRSDFADIFEVKSAEMVRRGRITTDWSDKEQRLKTTYDNEDFHRALCITAKGDCPVEYANGRLSFEVTLAPQQTWKAALLYALESDKETIEAPTPDIRDIDTTAPAKELAIWRDHALALNSDNEEFYRLYRQAIDDMASLRLKLDGQVVPAAGLPWFMVLFGRDSIIASLQTAILSPTFALGTLTLLGQRQALVRDDYRDAEPGKIMHELREGELAHFKLIPHTPYYGTADATPLYLMLLHDTWRWTGDLAVVKQHMEVAERCLTWIDQYGDRDGDGFQEYQTRSPQGYENMGWKDAEDAVVHADGTLAKGPKALCELQGYVYAAWTGMAEIYDALGQAPRATELRAKARALYEHFNKAFWNEDFGFYAFGLDGDKKQILSVASNVGHCLWTGIIQPDRARRVADRLLAPDMFSGWGVRTLSAAHPAFNPYSYHCGSVWPHDNGILARGLQRYGFAPEAAKVARAISGAASYFFGHQVPELFAGIARDQAEFPVPYLGSNVPQAWAAGSSFAFLQAMLGIEPDAPNQQLHVDPALPPWLESVTLRDLKLADMVFDLHFWRDGAATKFEVLKGDPAKVVRATAR